MEVKEILQSKELDSQVKTLTSLVVQEILAAFRNNPPVWVQQIMAAVLKFPAKKFARLLAEFDIVADNKGPVAACRHMFSYFFDHLEVVGQEKIPMQGPLILASNHPGGMDFVALGGLAGRDDIQVITDDVAMLRRLPAVREHLIMMPSEPREQFRALKTALDHLEKGGMLLLFPTGSIDPDPHYFRNAQEHLQRWSKSLEFFVRKVPEVKIQPIIVSEAIGERFLFNNIFVKRQVRRVDRQRLAEFLQVMNMVFLKGRRFNLKVLFGDVMQYQGTGKEDLSAFYEQIKINAERLLEQHLIQFPAVRQELWPEKAARFRNQ